MQIFAIVVSLAVTAVAVAMTAIAVRSMVRTLRIGGPAMNRSEQPGRRTWTMVKESLGHTRMLQWTFVGAMHWFVYAGFIVLSGAVATGYFQLFEPDFALPFIGHFFLYEWVSEGLGLLSTVGIVALIIYRQVNHPRRKGRKSRFYGSNFWQAYFVEAMALLEGSAILFIRGAEYNLGKIDSDHPEDFDRFHFPLSSVVGDAIFPTGAGSESTLETIIVVIAMIKILLAMAWLMVIASNLTMGVAWHRFTAWPNIWFKREPTGRTALGAVKPLTNNGERVSLDDIDDLDEDASLGVGSIEDFSWKNILDFTTCTECGRCQSQCPAWNTEKPLSPKLLITALRDHTYAKAPYSQAGGEGSDAATALLEKDEMLAREAERPLVGDTGDDWFYMPDSGAAVIDSEVLWNCTSCGACVQQCPVDIEHVDHIIDMRRYQVLVESNFPAELNGLFKGLENKGNPWNMSPNARMDWAKGLDFDVKVVGEDIESLEEVDWLFWVGCAGAYEDRQKKTTRAVAELLDMAGVSFGVLGNGETCSGDPARRAGNEFVFQGLAQQNVETFQEYKVKKAVTTCAHCFNTLKNEYKEFGIELEVVHHTQLLNRLVREGKLTPVNTGEGAHKRSITYHDPCYIGRHNGVYSPPRELLQVLPGAEYVEMERNSEKSFCCGAGGARMWMEENTGERINLNRTKEAVGTGADQIAVGCPFCRVMLSDGLTAQQSKGEAREEVEVLDVAQMLLASVKGEVATKIKPGGAAPSAKAAPSEDVKAEPEQGDDTQASDDVVTDTADAGPLAKASGGSSLFDTDAPDAASGDQAASASTDSSPAEEADAAAKAGSGSGSGSGDAGSGSGGGSSLFDLGGDDAGADEPAAKAAPAAEEAAEPEAAPKAEAKTEAKADSDLGSGGSLFDLGGGDEPAAQAEPAAKAEPEAPAEPAAKSEAAPAAQETDLGSGGSLFDIAAEEPAPAAPKAEEPKAEQPKAAEPEEPQAEEPKAEQPAAKQAEPAPTMNETDLSGGGSLFDIEAPAAPEPTAAPEAAAEPEPEVQPEAEAASEEDEVVESSPAPESADTTAEEVVETETATPAAESPKAAAAPSTSIPEGGSLFDIAAPEAVAQPEKRPERAPAASSTEAPAADQGETGTTAEPATPADAPTGEEVSAAATAIASDDPAPEPEAAAEAPAEVEADVEEESRTEDEAPAAEQAEAETEAEVETEEPAAEPTDEEPAEEKPKPTSSGAANQPRTDVEISEGGSLFDL
ncbi:heterodisulfide reductase-related iron-sulfur binding cluster [Nocardioides abyssi]|uniref:Heterodisulfide reductase-related iron-sulfur binding cluster n=1 Tax=Nocardioides abyssi TaxID=3058370 RepID=A0ABT8ERV0_9ACTN|nr:heterodisulfide reductase-related iron-sulfur binding cluster [Nocardioides abyssi]MDN4160847.1 heterodisulfide reductase-related iron-sulfur binding cluster [Nocardioides abyssi]